MNGRAGRLRRKDDRCEQLLAHSEGSFLRGAMGVRGRVQRCTTAAHLILQNNASQPKAETIGASVNPCKYERASINRVADAGIVRVSIAHRWCVPSRPLLFPLTCGYVR